MRLINSDNIISGISEKKDGPMKSFPGNRSLFFKNAGLAKKIVVSAGLVHGNRVAVVSNFNQEAIIEGRDALITNNSRYLLTITVADCLPVYFYDDNKKVVALAHAGWRGVVSGIAVGVLDSFVNHYGSDLRDVKVFIGPHIRDCHFEVGEDVAHLFNKDCLVISNGRKYINLSLAVRDQLIGAGVTSGNIRITDECTYCLDYKYFSFRRDRPEILDTMVAYIGLA